MRMVNSWRGASCMQLAEEKEEDGGGGGEVALKFPFYLI